MKLHIATIAGPLLLVVVSLQPTKAHANMDPNDNKPRRSLRYSSSGSRKGDGSGYYDDATSRLQPDDCLICSKGHKVRPSSLTLEYVGGGTGAISRFQSAHKASCRDQVFPSMTTVTAYGESHPVYAGTKFTITADRMDANTYFTFSSGSVDGCTIHTSCSAPLVAGDQLGPFKILEGNECQKKPCVCKATARFGPEEKVVDGCAICDRENKRRPSSLTLQYMGGGQGAISNHQTERKATCRDQVFPASTTLSAYGERFNVSPGTIFTIRGDGGRMDANTYFTFSSGNVDGCTVHTSCSAPIVVGDQIGPFKVLGGNDCQQPSRLDDQDKNKKEGVLTIEFDMCGYEPQEDDWIGIYPCDAPIMKADDEWNDWVFYADVFDEGYKKDTVYVNQEPVWFTYTCGPPESGCQRHGRSPEWPVSGRVSLDPAYANSEPWAFQRIVSLKPGCYKIQMNRFERVISAPPYRTICKDWEDADEFIVT